MENLCGFRYATVIVTELDLEGSEGLCQLK